MNQEMLKILQNAEREAAKERETAERVAALADWQASQVADKESAWMASSLPSAAASGLRRASVITNSGEASARLHENGLARVDGALSPSTVSALLEYISERLIAAKAAVEVQDYGPHHREALLHFGNVRRPIERADLKLRLTPLVAAAVAEALAPLQAVIADTLGREAELFELGAFVTDPGAPRQPVHPDTPYTPDPTACSTFIALQKIEEDMGPTVYLPGTHRDPAAHIALETREEDPDDGVADPGEAGAKERMLRGTPSQLAAPMAGGDSITFDSRVLHCGTANESTRRRVLFYFCECHVAECQGVNPRP